MEKSFNKIGIMITLQISEQQARKMYSTASKELKEILEASCSKEVLSGSIMDRVKTFEDACKELGRQPYNVDSLMKLGLTKNDIAYQKMVVIVEALNEGWKPDVCNSDVERWYPWFKPNGSPSSFAFGDSNCVYVLADAGSGSRLKLKSRELAKYCGEQFEDIWKDIQLG
jgi:hypothetical protein